MIATDMLIIDQTINDTTRQAFYKHVMIYKIRIYAIVYRIVIQNALASFEKTEILLMS